MRKPGLCLLMFHMYLQPQRRKANKMTYEQYEQRANEIDAWARAQYAAGKLSEDQIERRVERMYDALDDAYMPGRYVPDLYQSLSDFVEG